MKKILNILIVAMLFVVIADAQQTTSFSYQGRLNAASIPANGVYDFKFGLFRTPSDEFALIVIDRPAVQVTNGIFNVTLDFGAEGFIDGDDRYLEIAVKTQSGPSFTTLSPRQLLAAVPYATRAQNAGFANVAQTANNAANLGGFPAASFLQLNGDGSQLTNVAGAVPWQMISGNVLAARNRGYIVSSDGEVEISLPTVPQIGDVVRVAWGEGNGNFVIRTSPGQSIARQPSVSNSTWPSFGPLLQYETIASSGNGLKLAAAGAQTNGERKLFTSSDGGVNWTERLTIGTDRIAQIRSSADGMKLVAIRINGELLTSWDSGETWTPRANIGSGRMIAISADGTRLLAAGASGNIFMSSDSGANWNALESAGSRVWTSIALSGDGSRMIAGERDINGTFTARVWLSLDSGATWNAVRPPAASWPLVSISNDGSKMAVVGTELFYSNDSGATWTERTALEGTWSSLQMSGTGLKLMVVVLIGTDRRIRTSQDAGETWIIEENSRGWTGIAASSDFSRMYGVTNESSRFTIPGRFHSRPAGNVLGGIRGDGAIELLYVGSGKFTVLSSSGGISYF